MFFVFPAMYYVWFQLLWVGVIMCMSLDVPFGIFTVVLIGHHIYIHAIDYLTFVLFMVVPWQSVFHVQVCIMLVYNVNPVLVYLQHDMLDTMGQQGHILAEYCN